MQERHQYRGFTIDVVAQDDARGGSTVLTRIDRAADDARDADSREWSAPRHSRSSLRGKAAIGEALDDARRAIDSALGEPDVLEK